MSLCPYYCDCPYCEHGEKVCDRCEECYRERCADKQQKEHEASVRRQKSKLKIAPWVERSK